MATRIFSRFCGMTPAGARAGRVVNNASAGKLAEDWRSRLETAGIFPRHAAISCTCSYLHTNRIPMNRRHFLKTSAGFAAIAATGDLFAITAERPKKQAFTFETITGPGIHVPVVKVTPDGGLYQQTYFDITPCSPSQRYLVVSKLPFQERMPVIGDIAEVCVVDLHGQTVQTIYKTKSWGLQTGTNAQWGATDRHVYCNDIIGGTAVCVRIDVGSGEVVAFCGPKYALAPDESCTVSFPLELMDTTQLGYGCPPAKAGVYKELPPGASKTEGIWRTDLKNNAKKLIVSLADAAAILPPPPPGAKGYAYYFWHSKFNRQGTRVYNVVRCMIPGVASRNPANITFKPDGSDLHYCTPSQSPWGAPGGHPNWHPDGEHLVRHLVLEDKKDYFVKFKYDGSTFERLAGKCTGGGHPSMDITDRYIITDAQKTTSGKKTVSLRLVDTKANAERTVCTLPTIRWEKRLPDSVFRLDGHPCWSRDYKKVTLQAANAAGERHLYMVDLSGML
jgi:hypothetical protein